MRRFYKNVSLGDDFCILLDGKPVKTPAKVRLTLPTLPLAEAIAQEWRAQVDEIMPESMPLTKLANTAIDRVPLLQDGLVAELLGFGRSDLLCYRALDSVELIARQEEGWDPLLNWADRAMGARFKTTQGVGYIEQDSQTIAALDRVLRAEDGWVLTALHTATTITGSLVLAVAMAKGRLTAAQAFVLSRIDEAFQAEKWGADAEAEKRALRHGAELERAAMFIVLARA